LRYPHRKKSQADKSGDLGGPRHITEMGNDAPSKHVLKNVHCFFCSVYSGSILLEPNASRVYSSPLQFWSKEVAEHVSVTSCSNCDRDAVFLKKNTSHPRNVFGCPYSACRPWWRLFHKVPGRSQICRIVPTGNTDRILPVSKTSYSREEDGRHLQDVIFHN
jgi:hypothetical protein